MLSDRMKQKLEEHGGKCYFIDYLDDKSIMFCYPTEREYKGFPVCRQIIDNARGNEIMIEGARLRIFLGDSSNL